MRECTLPGIVADAHRWLTALFGEPHHVKHRHAQALLLGFVIHGNLYQAIKKVTTPLKEEKRHKKKKIKSNWRSRKTDKKVWKGEEAKHMPRAETPKFTGLNTALIAQYENKCLLSINRNKPGWFWGIYLPPIFGYVCFKAETPFTQLYFNKLITG